MPNFSRAIWAAFITISIAVSAAPTVAQTRTETGVYAELFHSDLAPYGRWVDHRVYGVVWVPGTRTPGWHPYTYGRWVWTSDYGWYWDSDEEFGWATYHYGRWAWTSDYGWVWVPDDVWGPAWVEWRYGDGHVGWCPMSPETRWHNGTVVYAKVGSGASSHTEANWVFVTQSDFARGEIHTKRQPPSRNAAMLAASADVTGYASVNGRVFNRGIDIKRLSAATKIKIAPTRTKITSKLAERDGGSSGSGSITIYRPSVAASTNLDLSAPPPGKEDLPWADTTGTDGAGAVTAPVDGQLSNRTHGSAGTSLDRDPLPDIGSAGRVDGGFGGRSVGGGVGGGIGSGVGGGGLRLGR